MGATYHYHYRSAGRSYLRNYKASELSAQDPAPPRMHNEGVDDSTDVGPTLRWHAEEDRWIKSVSRHGV